MTSDTTTLSPVGPEATSSNASLRRFLAGLPGVDEVGARQRATALSTRSLKASAKVTAVDLAISMVDLTTLEGADTASTVASLCAKAVRPDLSDPSTPSVAAVCVYSDLVWAARDSLAAIPGGDVVGVASVATAFPSGRATLAVKLADTAAALRDGACEIDMVIDRGAFLSGRYLQVFDEIAAIRAECDTYRRGGHVHPRLKVILETGELQTYDNVRRASWLAMLAGADFIKTSTGKTTPAATLPVTLVMLEAVRDFRDLGGHQVGVKAAGGIRTSKDALRYLVLVSETVGVEWLSPQWFRLGASTLLNDLLLQRRRLRSGVYTSPDDLTSG
ncbi:MAG: deoxyribose-phosphate aldolase [Actinomycetes bacterium]